MASVRIGIVPLALRLPHQRHTHTPHPLRKGTNATGRPSIELPQVKGASNVEWRGRFLAPNAALLALTLSAGSLTAACQGGSPTPLSSVAASASSSASVSPSTSSHPLPSPSPPYSAPPDAREQTEAGAIAFVRFYVEQVNRAWMTPDDTLIPPLVEPECQSCKAMQNNAKEYVALKHRHSTPAVEIVDLNAAPGAPDGQQFLEVKFHQLAASVVTEAGSVVSVKAENTFERRFLLTWKGDSWSVSGIG